MNNSVDNHVFESDNRLLIAIVDQIYKLKRICYACDIALLFFSGYMYNKFGKDVPFFIICELIAITALGSLQFFMLSPNSKFITKVVIEVKLLPGQIFIRTAAFDGPLWFKRKSVEYLFNATDVTMTMVNNPQPHIIKTEEQILLIRHQDLDLYVMPDHFDKHLFDELLQLI